MLIIQGGTFKSDTDELPLKMEKDRLRELFGALTTYFMEKKVVSEGELLLKIHTCVQSLSASEREELARRLRGDVERVIFKSITSGEKISVFSPDMHTRINYQGELFYTLPTHRYMTAELEEAFLRWARIRSPLHALKEVVTGFLEACQYQVNEGKSNTDHLELHALKEGTQTLHLLLFPSIKFVAPFREMHAGIFTTSEAGKEVVIIVPTEKTPAPFISFLRDQEIGGIHLWVADLEKRTINPLIGEPVELEIEKKFENPLEARRAVSVWMRKLHVLRL